MAREAKLGRVPARESDLPRPPARPKPKPPAVHAPGEVERRSNFAQEAWAELKKVEWPGQNQVIQGTVVVLIACLIVGVYLWLNDQVWKYVVEKIFI